MKSAAPKVSQRKPFVAPVVTEQPAMTDLTQGVVLVSGVNDVK